MQINRFISLFVCSFHFHYFCLASMFGYRKVYLVVVGSFSALSYGTSNFPVLRVSRVTKWSHCLALWPFCFLQSVCVSLIAEAGSVKAWHGSHYLQPLQPWLWPGHNHKGKNKDIVRCTSCKSCPLLNSAGRSSDERNYWSSMTTGKMWVSWH